MNIPHYSCLMVNTIPMKMPEHSCTCHIGYFKELSPHWRHFVTLRDGMTSCSGVTSDITTYAMVLNHAILMNIGPPRAPWCTMQVCGAQRRSVVHNVVLYRWGSAQCSSHKPTHTETHTNGTDSITLSADAGGYYRLDNLHLQRIWPGYIRNGTT